MRFYPKVVKCDNGACALPVFRMKAGKLLSDAEIQTLLREGRTGIIKGFNSRQGKPFEAALAFDESFNTVFVFPEKKRSGTVARKK